jgi:hypothetical protein
MPGVEVFGCETGLRRSPLFPTSGRRVDVVEVCRSRSMVMPVHTRNVAQVHACRRCRSIGVPDHQMAFQPWHRHFSQSLDRRRWRLVHGKAHMRSKSHTLAGGSHRQNVAALDRTPLETVLEIGASRSDCPRKTMVGGNRKQTWTCPDVQKNQGIVHLHRVPIVHSCRSVGLSLYNSLVIAPVLQWDATRIEFAFIMDHNLFAFITHNYTVSKHARKGQAYYSPSLVEPQLKSSIFQKEYNGKKNEKTGMAKM